MASSTTISSLDTSTANVIPSVTFTFRLATGNEGIKTIVDPLLKTQDIAYQRAVSEFMDNGYGKRYVHFETWRTDIKLNDIIEIKGLMFKVTNVNILSDDTKMTSKIQGIRYE